MDIGSGTFFLVALAGFILLIMSLVIEHAVISNAVLVVAALSSLTGFVGLGITVYKDESDRSYTDACRRVIEQNSDDALVPVCKAHVDKINAARAAVEAERQAARNKDDAETVRARLK